MKLKDYMMLCEIGFVFFGAVCHITGKYQAATLNVLLAIYIKLKFDT